jgi:hypothetical protein
VFSKAHPRGNVKTFFRTAHLARLFARSCDVSMIRCVQNEEESKQVEPLHKLVLYHQSVGHGQRKEDDDEYGHLVEKANIG